MIQVESPGKGSDLCEGECGINDLLIQVISVYNQIRQEDQHSEQRILPMVPGPS